MKAYKLKDGESSVNCDIFGNMVALRPGTTVVVDDDVVVRDDSWELVVAAPVAAKTEDKKGKKHGMFQ